MGSANPTRRVLVVEDNVDSADTLAVLLKMLGFDPVVARDGLEALEVADRLQPDVVLLDIALPKVNGYDVCRYIRATQWGKNSAVIAVTGFGQSSDVGRSNDAGIDVHLLKPTLDSDLLSAIQSAIDIGHTGTHAA